MTDSDPRIDPDRAVTIGRITDAHALKGEVRVRAFTDFPERFDKGNVVWLDGEPREIEMSRWQGASAVIKLAGVSDRTGAEAIIGKELMLPEPAELGDEGRFYLHDVVGLRVESVEGEVLGKVSEVLATGSNDVYVVRGERGELLVPAVEDIVTEVDPAAGRVVVNLVEGLEFIAPKKFSVKKRRPSGPEKAGHTPPKS